MQDVKVTREIRYISISASVLSERSLRTQQIPHLRTALCRTEMQSHSLSSLNPFEQSRQVNGANSAGLQIITSTEFLQAIFAARHLCSC